MKSMKSKIFAAADRGVEMPAYYRKLQKREIVSLIGDWR